MYFLHSLQYQSTASNQDIIFALSNQLEKIIKFSYNRAFYLPQTQINT